MFIVYYCKLHKFFVIGKAGDKTSSIKIVYIFYKTFVTNSYNYNINLILNNELFTTLSIKALCSIVVSTGWRILRSS